MTTCNPYKDVLSAICALRKKGFIMDYRLHADLVRCVQTGEVIEMESVSVREYHFFDGVDQPEHLHIVLGIQSPSGMPGVLKMLYDPIQIEKLQKIA